ncbi:MAG: ice-binding family protein [Nocardioidaceae bacterium]
MVPRRWALALTVPLVLALIALVSGTRPAAAAEAPVNLRTTASFAVLAGSTVTTTGPSVINGNLGLYPGTSITGFPPGIVNGTIHKTDAVAQQAQSDLTIAYNDAASRGPGAAASELGGRTLVAGVYTGTALTLTGTLTLDGQGDPNAVFIFQSGSTLITASNSTVALINGAQACNVFWQVGSSATLGTNTTFVGTILALTSITAQTGTTVNGRLLARNGAVTLDNNVITASTCSTATTTTTSTSTNTSPTSTTTSPTSTTTSPTSTTTSPTSTTTSTTTPAAAVTVPGAGAPHTGDTGGELPASPLNAFLAVGLFTAAGAVGLHLRRRTGRH